MICRSAAADRLDRLAAGAGELRLRLSSASSRTSISPRSRAAPTSSPASSSAIPTAPVWTRRDPGAGPRHGGRCLGRGRPARSRREKGELVCTKAVPVDAGRCSGTTPTAQKYRAAYFERFPSVWCHGDFAEWTEHGGLVIHGRSDATLNPGGVRIGTAEIYAQVEQIPEIARERSPSARTGTATCGSSCSSGCSEGVTLDDALQRAIKTQDPHRRQPAPCAGQDRRGRRHPAHQVGQDHRACRARRGAWPRRSRTSEALANPEALDLFRDLAELRQ